MHRAKHLFSAILIGAAMVAAAVAAPPEAPPKPALMTWPDLLTRPHPKPNATIPYGADPLQVADLWLPRGRGPFRTVLMIHGGCWQTAIADRHIMDWIANDLRARGIAVWNIDYRGVDRPGGGYPGTFQDTAKAADALRASARQYRLDLRRVVAVGHSAGGHLAPWLAGRPRLPAASPLRSARPLPIAAVVSLGGLPDLEVAQRFDNGCGKEVAGTLSGGRLDDTSVPRLAPLKVRQILVNGRNDRIIPVHFATDYQKAMQAAGDIVTVQFVDRTGHVELIAPETRAWKLAVKDIKGAFRR